MSYTAPVSRSVLATSATSVDVERCVEQPAGAAPRPGLAGESSDGDVALESFALGLGAEPPHRLLHHTGEFVDASHRRDQRPLAEQIERRADHRGRGGEQHLVESID